MFVKELQKAIRDLIDEVEIRKGIGLSQLAETIADLLFDTYTERDQMTDFIAGCFSPEAKEIYKEDCISSNWK
jgi:hypothetical protein